MSTAAFRSVLKCLELEKIDSDLYRGFNDNEQRLYIFGGQVVAQALRAAMHTVEGRAVHSLHAYFLRRGETSQPILYRVDRSREGRSFATRQVVAMQEGLEIFHMIASFQRPETGFEHQLPMPEAPDPESLSPHVELARRHAANNPQFSGFVDGIPRAFDMRFAVVPVSLGGESSREPGLGWLRAPASLPDDPELHRCLLAYATDMWFNDAAARVHRRDKPLMGASLDHVVWFHEDVRVDDWLLFTTDSPRASGARGLTRGSFFNSQGVQVASVAQEALMRPYEKREREK